MLDISGRLSGPAGRLSNFTARDFIFDCITCASLEGALQAFKFEDVKIQVAMCRLTGKEAQVRGQERNDAWKETQTLWWNGNNYPRESREYQTLLDRLYETVFQQDASFRQDLWDSQGYFLRHSIGKHDPTDTILTELEFCHRLMMLRARF